MPTPRSGAKLPRRSFRARLKHCHQASQIRGLYDYQDLWDVARHVSL
jgi:hypothetical protein